MATVSVIATVLNEKENIARLVESLLLQTPPAAEIVVVDGGSCDGTWQWLQQAAALHPTLRILRDESCNLKSTPGPISKGRNVAIAASRSELIACVDAGCRYEANWLSELTGPLVREESQYVLGGACLDWHDATVWDIASAPFFGVKMTADAPTKSCTARSMAFTKQLWRKLGGFPETVFFGEDTLFDLEARRVAQPAFPLQAKALYRPRNSFASACGQMARYAASDGVLGVRKSRLMRNAARCIVEVAALILLPWTWIPLGLVAVMVLHFAFEPDWLFVRTARPHVLAARLLFSMTVPWIVTIYRTRGSLTKKQLENPQNTAQTSGTDGMRRF
ncbi:MAG TPA: glycosyltransferase [Terracidiphilus sp.]|nr:glycosyltransferase [Terracidiphilus sp.]